MSENWAITIVGGCATAFMTVISAVLMRLSRSIEKLGDKLDICVNKEECREKMGAHCLLAKKLEDEIATLKKENAELKNALIKIATKLDIQL